MHFINILLGWLWCSQGEGINILGGLDFEVKLHECLVGWLAHVDLGSHVGSCLLRGVNFSGWISLYSDCCVALHSCGVGFGGLINSDIGIFNGWGIYTCGFTFVCNFYLTLYSWLCLSLVSGSQNCGVNGFIRRFCSIGIELWESLLIRKGGVLDPCLNLKSAEKSCGQRMLLLILFGFGKGDGLGNDVAMERSRRWCLLLVFLLLKHLEGVLRVLGSHLSG